MREGWLLLETSASPRLGVSADGEVIAVRDLEPGRRHNRDLVPAMQELVRESGFTFAELTGIRIGTGPGSYTGLRIGITAAKALAYALDKPLVAVPTYAIIANRASSELPRLDIIGDALNRTIYVQRFGPMDARTGLRSVLGEVHLEGIADYLQGRHAETWIGGPGATTFTTEFPIERCLPLEMRSPDTPTMERIGRTMKPLNRSEMLALEPLYLRGSSAEEKVKAS